ncbi:MAG: glycosyltransferase family 10 domain-containing protein, partial [Desulfomonilaceae bacterium]
AIDYIRRIRDLNFANRPSECSNKIRTLGKFRFNLVFENCIFPGYLTEKIFDAMLAGTVPIYLGAPDIQDFVPKECFVDFRDYHDFNELWQDIASWDEKHWLGKIDAIKSYLSSNQFEPFRREKVAENYFRWLTEEN